MKRLNLSPDTIRKLYWEERKSLPEIGELLGISSGTLYRWMKRHDISTRSKKEAGDLRRKVQLKPKELRRLYWVRKKSTDEIGKMFGTSGAAILYWMKKYRIPIRSKSEASNTKLDIPIHKLSHLYITEKKSSIEIGKLLNVSSSAVCKWLRRYKIPLRSRSEVCRKYPRHPFSGNGIEKQYLLGFCAGDAYVYKESRTIVVQTTTTHPAMIKLFSNLFSRYGHFGKYPGKNKHHGYQWHLYTRLDESFGFLLHTNLNLPKNELFYSFLAGYSDAEGYWGMRKSHENKINRIFEIQSQDFQIIKQIKLRLGELGYTPTFGLKKEADGISLKKNLYYIRLCKRYEVFSLAKKLKHYSRHEEKLDKIKLILRTTSQDNWENIKPKVERLKKKIKMEIKRCKQKAGKEYERRQNCL